MLADIYDAYRGDRRFDHLRTDGIVLVPGEGSSRPKVFIVGEAPGAMENTHKKPFVGASGQVLRSLIKDTAGLAPEDYFITNVVKYRPPNNRTPEWQEVDASLPYLRQEFAALGLPAVIVAVGGVALSVFRPSGETRSILACAGETITLRGGKALVPMIHPSYVLRKGEPGTPERDKWQAIVDGHWTEFGNWYREEYR